jgi:excisionase family DNA binding protein
MSNRNHPRRQPPPWPREGLARIPEAAKFLAVSRTTLYDAIRAGRIPTVTIGTDRRIPWPDLHRLAHTANK